MTDYGQPLLLDNSVWARALDGRLAGPPRGVFDAALAAGELWTCPPALLEMRYSARDEFDELADELGALFRVPLDAQAADAALVAQEELARTPGVSHRVKPVDLLIAGVAATQGIGVLHYDRDYDTITQNTSLAFTSVWVAPRGSIG
ncbi:MAG TPA: PIN domain-containing protein [Solirubrobacteraceae bacterium]